MIVASLLVSVVAIRAEDRVGTEAPGEGTIHVVLDDNYPPYIFEDEKGALQGILVDQWRLWEQKTGVTVQLHAMAWREALDRMRGGEFDVIDTVFETPSRTRFFDFAEPYARIEVAIFFRSEIAGIADLSSLEGFTVGVKRGDAAVDVLEKAGITKLQFFPSYENLVAAATRGKVDVFVADVPPTLYYLYKGGASEAFHRSAPISVGEFHRAVQKGDVKTLGLVEEGFARIAPTALAEIDRRWMGEGLVTERYLHLIGIGAVVALLAALVLLVWTRTLRLTVAKRTAALKESEARFRALFEHAPVAYQSLDQNGCFIDANERLCELLGCSRADLLGRSFGSFWPENRRGGFLKRFEAMGACGCTAGELELVRSDGVQLTVYLEGRVQYDDAGRFGRTHCILIDMSDRVRAEAALRENEERLRMAINASKLGTFDWNVVDGTLTWSRRHEEIWGYAPGEFAATFAAFASRLHPEDAAKVDAEITRCIAQREDFEYRFRIVWPDGSVHWVLGLGQFTFDKDGDALRMAGVAMEITDQVLAESRVRSMARFPEENPNPVLRVGRDGSILYANTAASAMLRLWGTSVGGPVSEDWRVRIVAALESGNGAELDVECEERIYSIRVVPVAGENDVNLFGRDVTARRRAEARAESERRRFEQLFEVSPVATWLEDFSDLVRWMDALRAQGVSDLRAFLAAHPERVAEALACVRVLDLNPAAVEQNGATSKDELIASLAKLFTRETFVGLAKGLAALWEGHSMIEYESVSQRLDGRMIDVLIRIHVPRKDGVPDYGFTTVTSVDISDLRRIERDLRYHQELLTETGRLAHVGGWEFDVATGKGTWTEEVARIHDLDPDGGTDLEIGLGFYEGESRSLIEHAIKDAIELAEPYDLELELRTAAGVRKWVRTIGYPVLEDGRVVRVRGSFQDISDRKAQEVITLRANRALRMLSECNQALVRAEQEFLLLEKVCAAIVGVGNYAGAFVGYLDEGTKNGVKSVASAGGIREAADEFARKISFLASDGDPVAAAVRLGDLKLVSDLRDLAATVKWRDVVWQHGFAALVAVPLVSSGKVFGAMCVFSNDATAFEESERALLAELADDLAFGIAAIRTRAAHARAEASLESAQAIAHMGNWELDLDAGTGWWSGEMYRLFDRDVRLGPPPLAEFLLWVHPDDVDRLLGMHKQVVEMLGSGQATYRTHPDRGPIRWFETAVTASRASDSEPVRVVGTVLEVTGRMRAERAVRESEERLRTLIEQALDLITVVDGAGVIRFQSPAAERILGTDARAMVGQSVFEWLHPDDRSAARETVAKAVADPGSLFRASNRYRHADGTWRVLESVGRCVSRPGEAARIVVNSRDVTASRKLEEQFRQSQKMEAVGRLAGGVAHDFNNILTVVQGNVSLLELEENLGQSARESISEIKHGASRAANLTRQMLTFSRRQTMQPQHLDLNEVVTNVTRMLNRLLGEDIRLELSLASQEIVVFADNGMIEQVLVNLAVNARDAMPSGGRLIIETGWSSLDEGSASAMAGARPGEFSWVSVTDTGVGMAPEVLENIFEPFFTTKELGRGTGLGLATVHGIVQQHNGWMEVTSRVGGGSRFRAFLPRTMRGPETARAAKEAAAARRGSETILLVEDEPAVRQVARNLLAPLGYRVIEAGSGPEALVAWEKHRGVIDLVLTDLVMPDGMSGLELGRRLLSERPELKIIYTSGYSAQIVGRHDELQEGVNFLAKPFDMDRLMATIRIALDGRSR